VVGGWQVGPKEVEPSEEHRRRGEACEEGRRREEEGIGRRGGRKGCAIPLTRPLT
jgi:hypothetical protein